MKADIVPGAKFPDCILPGRTGASRRLSQIKGDQLMIVMPTRGFFARGSLAHAGTAAVPPAVCGRLSKLVAITTDDWHTTNTYRQQTSALWPFRYDEERVVQKGPEITE